MKRSQLRRNIKQIVDQVVTLAHPRRIILFGSAATGDFDQDSDLDFLVVVAEADRSDELIDRLNMEIRPRPMPCDFMVVTESALERQLGNPGLIYGDIMAQGREVYAV